MALSDAPRRAASLLIPKSGMQRMEPSNVGGGFWQQLPARMQQTWPFKQKTGIEIECDEVSRKHSAIKKERGLATWEFQVPPHTCATLVQMS